MGLKQEYDSVVEKHRCDGNGLTWQASRERSVSNCMDLVGGAAVHVCEFSKKGPTNAMFSNAYRVPVNQITHGRRYIQIRHKCTIYIYINRRKLAEFAPETGLARYRYEGTPSLHVVAVQVVDMTWVDLRGFKNVIEVLSGKIKCKRRRNVQEIYIYIRVDVSGLHNIHFLPSTQIRYEWFWVIWVIVSNREWLE
jgi:hypothetical protein